MDRKRVYGLIDKFNKIFKDNKGDYDSFVTAIYIFLRYDNELFISDDELDKIAEILSDLDSIFSEYANDEIDDMLENGFEEEDDENG